MEFFKHSKIIDFIKISRVCFPISVLIFLASIALFIYPGFSLGIDFAGGTLVQVRYEGPAPIPQIREILNASKEYEGAQVSEFGDPQEVLIRYKSASSIVAQNISEEIHKTLESTGNFEVRRVDIVGPKVGKELTEKGTIALILAFLMIAAYVGYRYEKRFALAALAALIHDVVIAAGAVVFFKIDLNLEVIAAFLTIIGYSVNDTIIIFDRIRERIDASQNESLAQVINEAVSATLSRTTLTTLTTFFTVLTLYLFGSEILVGFSLPMLVGTIAGTWSTIFVASKLIMIFGFNPKTYRENLAKKRKKELEKAKMRAMYERGAM